MGLATYRSMQKSSLVFLLLFLPHIALAADVLINEVAWMGSLPKNGETNAQASNNEWIELKNTTGGAISLEGWTLKADDETPSIVLSGTISAFGYFILERTSDDTLTGVIANQIYVGALSNSGEKLILKNAEGVSVDEVDAISGWPAGDNTTKDTMQKVGTQWVTASPTPGILNAGDTTPSPPAPSASSSALSAGQTSSSQSYTSPSNFPTIRVNAGGDRKVIAGSDTKFLGGALDTEGKPLENVRFLWNFGDGSWLEGRSIFHIFQVPGIYTVGLHVSSGIYSSSDYALIEAVPNKVKITSVLFGREGFIKFLNPEPFPVDIGGWILEDGTKSFTIPYLTKIGVQAEIALPNSVTGLLQEGKFVKLFVRYPNARLAIEWQKPAVDPLPVEVARLPVETKIPVAENDKLEVPRDSRETAEISSGSAVVPTPYLWIALILSFFTASAYFVFKKWKNRAL